MKIEKISDNQIKCTLNRSDLASRQIKLSELVYGTEKTQDLFQDMMDQAYEEYGFETSDLPLMIEAIPVSMDCIVLMITKVEDPDEIDTEFSSFSNLNSLIAGGKSTGDDAPAVLGGGFPGFLKAKQSAGENGPEKKQENTSKPVPRERVFSFESLSTVIDFAHKVQSISGIESSLYKSGTEKKYFLMIDRGRCPIPDYAFLCNAALEYGVREPVKGAGGVVIKEHCEKIIGSRALAKLAEI